MHPFASVTVTIYGPAQTPVTFHVVAPLLHKYVYGAVPPVELTVNVPVQEPP